jgi:transcriptional regulator with PAS, ATPase and Fis domain
MKAAVVLALRFHEDRNIPVLIEGETGTGKEVIARLVHQGNSRENRPFVSVNCSAISPSLYESELFGYEGGAFTGSKSRGAMGKMESSKGGTLFLDEIADMPLEMQPKLLRALQEKEIYRVGGSKRIKLDIRIIVATNRNLRQCMEQGHFRKDLFFRLNLGRIYIPTLREQKESIVPLSQMFLSIFAEQKKRRFRFIHRDAMKILEDYPWPGNIRELRNTIERVIILNDEEELRGEHLDFLTLDGREQQVEHGTMIKPGQIALPPSGLNLPDLELEIIRKTLYKFNNNKTKAAEYLGISRHAIRTRLQRGR